MGIWEEWGQLLLSMLDDVAQVPEGDVKWRFRRQLDADATRQTLFSCATRFGEDVQASFASYVMLRHQRLPNAPVAPTIWRPSACC